MKLQLQLLKNVPAVFADRWQQPGDVAVLARAGVRRSGTELSRSISYFTKSDAVYSDASFARLRSLALSYSVPVARLGRIFLQEFRISVVGQNLLTLTDFPLTDPETMGMYTVPPPKTVAVGLHASF